MSIIALAVVGYLAVFMCCWGPATGVLAWRTANRHNTESYRYVKTSVPDSNDWAVGAWFGFWVSILWPMGLAAWTINTLTMRARRREQERKAEAERLAVIQAQYEAQDLDLPALGAGQPDAVAAQDERLSAAEWWRRRR